MTRAKMLIQKAVIGRKPLMTVGEVRTCKKGEVFFHYEEPEPSISHGDAGCQFVLTLTKFKRDYKPDPDFGQDKRVNIELSYVNEDIPGWEEFILKYFILAAEPDDPSFQNHIITVPGFEGHRNFGFEILDFGKNWIKYKRVK